MGVFFAPWGFFFSKDLLLFLTQKIFFSNFFCSKKKFFESKTTVNPLRKKKPMGQTDLSKKKQNKLEKKNLT